MTQTISFEEADLAVANFQADHKIMTMEECLTWIEEERTKYLPKAGPAKPRPVTMEDLIEAAAETPEGEKLAPAVFKASGQEGEKVSEEATSWHELAYKRVEAGIGDEWDKTLERHGAGQEILSGMWEWFKNNYPQKCQALKDCETRINELWKEGVTEEKAQDEFNAQLRIYRNGNIWLIDKFLSWKKETAGKPAQAKLI